MSTSSEIFSVVKEFNVSIHTYKLYTSPERATELPATAKKLILQQAIFEVMDLVSI